jgi:hypothetical protein
VTHSAAVADVVVSWAFRDVVTPMVASKGVCEGAGCRLSREELTDVDVDEMPLPPRTLVECVVDSVQPWGVFVRLLPPAPPVRASIDLLYMEGRSRVFAVGDRVRAVVLDPFPGEVLRLSTREQEMSHGVTLSP